MPAMYKGKAVFGVMGSDGSGNSGGEVYSTEETVIGTWIDGKPLYRKAVTIENVSASNIDNSIFSLPQECIIQKWDGWLNTPMADYSYMRYPLNYNRSNLDHQNEDWVCVSAVNNELYIAADPLNKHGLTIFVILEYTKTSDQAGS